MTSSLNFNPRVISAPLSHVKDVSFYFERLRKSDCFISNQFVDEYNKDILKKASVFFSKHHGHIVDNDDQWECLIDEFLDKYYYSKKSNKNCLNINFVKVEYAFLDAFTIKQKF